MLEKTGSFGVVNLKFKIEDLWLSLRLFYDLILTLDPAEGGP